MSNPTNKTSFATYCILFMAAILALGGCSDSDSEPTYFFEYTVDGQQFVDETTVAQNINGKHLFITHREVNSVQIYLVPDGSNTLSGMRSLSLGDVSFRCSLNYHEYENADIARFTRVFSAGDQCMLQLTEWENTHDNVVVLSGQFSGNLVSDDGSVVTVSDGRFRLPAFL